MEIAVNFLLMLSDIEFGTMEYKVLCCWNGYFFPGFSSFTRYSWCVFLCKHLFILLCTIPCTTL